LGAGSDLANMMSDINAGFATSGVLASDNGAGHLKLTAADGRNITVSAVTSTGGTLTAAKIGIADAVGAVTTYGSVSLSSASSFTIAGANPGRAGANLTAQTVAASTNGTVLSQANVLSASAANTAIATIDAALATVNSARASLGAYQNRFSSAVSNLQTTAENLTASRSRIQDADFASETAAMTRGQILQQAGTAILAQANSLPNSVLSLLK
jgi:flagellin